MKEIDLKVILNGNIEYVTKFYDAPDDPELKIVVLPVDVKKILMSYLKGDITLENLNIWAEFLCFRGEYVCNDWESDESADYYEDMWYVVQKLSTPEIDGEITPDTVRVYLEELDKYFSNESESANDAF